MEETPEKESAVGGAVGVPEAERCARETSSTSTLVASFTTTDSAAEGRSPSAHTADHRSDDALKAAFRQTVEELEARAEAQGGDRQLKKSLSRATSTSSNSTETGPGAFAIHRSDSDASTTLTAGDESTPEPSSSEETRCCTAPPTATEEVPMIHAQLATNNQPPVVQVHQAQLAEDPPEVTIAIPQAQLVTPPQEALHVQFDEEAPTPPGLEERGPAVPRETVPEPTKVQRLWAKHGKPCLRFNLLLLVVGLIAGIIVPRVHEHKRSEDLEDRLEWLEGFLGEDLQIALTAPTPAPSHQTVYDCYDSTLKIAMAQAEDPTKTKFIICPNTLIPVGYLNEDQEIEGGDYPLTVLGDSVEIICGIDGRRGNHCFLDGGFLQVLVQPSLPDLLAKETVNRTDNVVFRGITFTGNLNASNEMIGGVSVLANNPGDITFVDCAWENMTAPRGVAQIGDSHDAMTFAPTTDVTFEDCSFSNIVYDGPLIGVYGQGVTLRRSFFEDLVLPDTIEPCQVEGAMDWCQGLLYCFERSACELEDICVQGLEYAGPAAIATASSQTNLTVYGAKQSFGLNLHPSVMSTSSNTTCSTGLAQFDDPDYQNPECLLESSDWVTTNFCML